MASLMSILRAPVSRFAREERGTIVAEAVIVLPLFLWAYLALFVYWDSFRSLNSLQKAAYTVSDMLSREMQKAGITTSYITGMNDVMDYLMDRDQPVRMRVTSVTWSATNDRYEVHWSRSPHSKMIPLTTATLQGYAYQIPEISDGAFVIIVEVESDYVPTFEIGMADQVYHEFIVTPQRFLPQCLPIDGGNCVIS